MSQGSPEKQNQQERYIYKEKEIYFKELAHVMVEVHIQNLQGRLSGLRPREEL